MGLDMLVLDLVWARCRMMSGEVYIGGRTVLYIQYWDGMWRQGIRSKNRPSIGETSENVLDPDKTW